MGMVRGGWTSVQGQGLILGRTCVMQIIARERSHLEGIYKPVRQQHEEDERPRPVARDQGHLQGHTAMIGPLA